MHCKYQNIVYQSLFFLRISKSSFLLSIKDKRIHLTNQMRTYRPTSINSPLQTLVLTSWNEYANDGERNIATVSISATAFSIREFILHTTFLVHELLQTSVKLQITINLILAKWLNVRFQTKWLWIRIPLLSNNLISTTNQMTGFYIIATLK